jgi:ATP-dependent RNA helicase RhlE
MKDPVPAATGFAALGLRPSLLQAVAARGYLTPTPIQERAIPELLRGRDLLGIAQTGTGKTAAFALPMLQLLSDAPKKVRPSRPRALVLAPTRELATQIGDSCTAYGQRLHLRTAVIFGGVGQTPQVDALRRGIDILVATPGRLLDLIHQGRCNLGDVEILVLDEADRMLDMGFLPDVRRILATLPKERHSLLFSATMPADITNLAKNLLRDPVRVEVTPPAATADRVAQSVHFVKKDHKRDLLVDLLEDPVFVRTLVFTRTKHGADRVVKHLRKAGIHANAIHGNKSQGARERALDDFRDGEAPVLVATDIAARGIDVPEISHVVNFDLPNIPESYVHRIGRTARAGREGIAISFCDETEREYLRDIEKLIRQKIPNAQKIANESAPGRQTGKQTGKPTPERHKAATPQHEEPRPRAADDAFGTIAERPAQPRERQRPAPRSSPGPYEPSPPRKGRPQHTGPRHERKPKRPGRPATPHLVDPELRRGEAPRPQQTSKQDQAPRQNQGRRRNRRR